MKLKTLPTLPSKKEYRKPVLKKMGDIRKITRLGKLGSLPDPGEENNYANE